METTTDNIAKNETHPQSKIKTLVEDIKSKSTQSDENCISVGNHLNECRPIVLETGKKYEDWFNKQNFNFSFTTAKRYMRIATGVKARPTLVSLGLAKADILLRLNDEQYADFKNKYPLDDLSVRDIEEKVREIKTSSSFPKASLQKDDDVDTEPIYASLQIGIDHLKDYINKMIKQFSENKDSTIFDLRTLCEETIERIEEISETYL